MKTTILLTTLACLAAADAAATTPAWLETDSAAAIETRIRRDFPYTVEQFKEIAAAYDSTLTPHAIDELIGDRFVETLVIDDTVRVFRKALRNLYLLDPARNEGWRHRGADPGEVRLSYVDSVLDCKAGRNPMGGAHRVTYRFIVQVPNHDAIQGDTLRIWMPYPLASDRQDNIRLLETSHPAYTMSDGRSVHNTIYFEVPVGAAGDTTTVSYTATFDNHGQYFPEEEIMSAIKPYDTTSEVYRRYTRMDEPHIADLSQMARAIADGETNPYLISRKILNYISRYPWAGAREYSTLECIPEYVIREGHGDCGQVSLLYISMMRSLGIPARWESGWMLHPGEKNYHDWAEVYFEGVGWVPVDASFGRLSASENPDMVYFYNQGMDAHRFASNLGVCGELYPAKRYVRSETVDFQAGEVETSRGNLFYPAWDSTFDIISIIPIETK